MAAALAMAPLPLSAAVHAALAAEAHLVASPAVASSLVIVDADVDDVDTLLDGIAPDATVLHIRHGEHALDQLRSALAGVRDVRAVHIVSHGRPGHLRLAGEWVDATRVIETLEGLSGLLAEGADVHLYGCNVAQGDAGERLARAAAISGVDLRASVDLTGATAGGGDWDLELVRGDIDSITPFSAKALRDFTDVLQVTAPANTWTVQAGNGIYVGGPGFRSPAPDTSYVVRASSYYNGQLPLDRPPPGTAFGIDQTYSASPVGYGGPTFLLRRYSGAQATTMSAVTIQVSETDIAFDAESVTITPVRLSGGPGSFFPDTANAITITGTANVLDTFNFTPTAWAGFTNMIGINIRVNDVADPGGPNTQDFRAFRLGPFGALSVAPPSGVVISDATPASVLYAREIVASEASPVTLTNVAGSLNLTSALGYSFSQGEVRYARVECPTVRFLAGSTVVASDDSASTLGAINGLGSSAITFSITADTNGLTATDTITVTGNRQIAFPVDANCSFSLYDNPSEAQAGGSAGRIVTRSGEYLRFGPSWQLLADPVFTSTANVEANPSFTTFVPSGDTTTSRAGLSELTYGLRTPTPLRIDGTPITLADLMATGADGTRLVVTGEFDAAANADGSYTGAALNRVFLATNDTCATPATVATALTARTATFNVGATAFTDDNLCLQVNGTTAVQTVDYIAQIAPVAASPAYRPTANVPIAVGRIIRNGTELQAPLVQVPTGFASRIALTNTGGVARTFTWRFLPASGGTTNEASTTTMGATSGTGTIPANGSVVIGLTDVLGGFGTTPPRGTFVVSAAAPNNQIQGLYQIVNPSRGTISNHVMVRPGSN